jgi:chromosome partitioning protein
MVLCRVTTGEDVMRVFVTAAQKGGVGKTTLTVNLACAAIHAGAGPVYLFDGDPQQTLARRWATPRRADVPTLLTGSVSSLAAAVEKLRDQPGTLFVDTPPALTRDIALTVATADLVVVPAQPSPVDLDAVGATVDLLEQAGKEFVFVVNRASKRSRWTVPTVGELSQHGPVCPTVIHDWTVLREGFLDGTAVVETAPVSDAAAEITALWTYLDAKASTHQSIKRSRRKA